MTNEEKEMTMNRAAKIGALVGLVLFLCAGLIPASLYGGYMGTMMATTLFGPITTANWVTQIIIAGGVCLGICATLSLFLILGALLGAGSYSVYHRLS
jgi:hypothetical protein